MNLLVFYAGLLYGEYDEGGFRLLRMQCSSELYNGGYVYSTKQRNWSRMDGTPLLKDWVPPNLKAMLLLLT